MNDELMGMHKCWKILGWDTTCTDTNGYET